MSATCSMRLYNTSAVKDLLAPIPGRQMLGQRINLWSCENPLCNLPGLHHEVRGKYCVVCYRMFYSYWDGWEGGEYLSVSKVCKFIISLIYCLFFLLNSSLTSPLPHIVKKGRKINSQLIKIKKGQHEVLGYNARILFLHTQVCYCICLYEGLD